MTTSTQAKVVSTLPEFSWVVSQLLPSVESLSLLEGVEDPHFVDASPSFVFKLSKAKVLVLNGLDLEVGWLPAVIQMSGNARVQPGAKGYCNAGLNINVIEKIDNYDRSMGDIHAQGNPHYTISLKKMATAAETIKECLVKAGYDNKKLESNLKKLKEKFTKLNDELKKQWNGEKTVYVYHREFNYLAKEFPIVLKESLEAVPGILPSANYLVKMAKKSKKDKPEKVLAAYTAPTKVLEKFKELSGVSYNQLQLHPTRDQDYLKFIKDLHQKILK